MNYLKELFYGRTNNTLQTVNSNKTKKNVTEYAMSFCQFKRQRTGMLHPLYASDQVRGWFIDGIKNNIPDFNSTFPVFDEQITNATDYNKLISSLEKKYTDEAIKNKNSIQIIKTVIPYTFQYDGKEYDFTDYNFKVIINNDKNDYIP